MISSPYIHHDFKIFQGCSELKGENYDAQMWDTQKNRLRNRLQLQIRRHLGAHGLGRAPALGAEAAAAARPVDAQASAAERPPGWMQSETDKGVINRWGE